MNPKSGKAGTPVEPTAPEVAEEADKADPGLVEQIKALQRLNQTGKYGSSQPPPHKSPQTAEEKKEKKSWIEIEMVDEDSQPVTGQAYRITLPDGTVSEGTLDEKGLARIEGISAGSCDITFPDRDKEAWTKL